MPHFDRQWSPQRPPPGHYVKAPAAGSGSHGHREFHFAAKEQRKASTMDGDKRRLFLERMRASPFHNAAAAGGGSIDARSRSNESSYRVRQGDSFYVKQADLMRYEGGGGSGFRSLSTESHNRRNAHNLLLSSHHHHQQPQSAVVGLFCDEEDESPLQMSSVDATGGPQCVKQQRRLQAFRQQQHQQHLHHQHHPDVIDTVVDGSNCEEIMGAAGQFSLSTPDFGASRHQPQQPQQPQNPQQVDPKQQQQKLQPSSQKAPAAAAANSSSSYSSLRSKLRSVQERYKKSSVTNKFKAKFGGGGGGPGKPDSKLSDPANVALEVSKFRSHSHGALHSLNEFERESAGIDDDDDDEGASVDDDDLMTVVEKDDWKKKGSEVTTVTIEAQPAQMAASAKSTSSGASSQTGSSPCTPRIRLTSSGGGSSGGEASTSSAGASSTMIKKKKGKGAFASLMGSGKSKSTEAVSTAAAAAAAGGSSEFDHDSGILNEAGSDSLSSGSDSGFYHTGGRRERTANAADVSVKSSSVGQSSPRYSTCSSRCSSSEFETSPPGKVSQGTETDVSTLKAARWVFDAIS